MLAFALASAVGGIAGYLVLATDQQVTPMFGMWATFKGLIAMMIGGLGSIPGAILGGLVLGIVEAHSQWYFGPQVRDLFAYLLLFACLVLRPGGLLGEPPTREPALGPRESVRWTTTWSASSPTSASSRSSRCRPICSCSPAKFRSASRRSSRSAPMRRESRPRCGAGRSALRSSGAPPTAGGGGRAGRPADAAAARALLRGCDARLRRDGAARCSSNSAIR